VKEYLLGLLEQLLDVDGELLVGSDTKQILGQLRHACHAVHQVLMDTFTSSLPRIKALIQHVWENSPDVEVPVALQPPSVRVKVVAVQEEMERQRKSHTYPSNLAGEVVLLQYTVDTQLDKCLEAAMQDIITPRILTGNPVSKVLSRFKAAAQRFELWKETDEELVKPLLNQPVLITICMVLLSHH
jgi:hypothetical protein